MGASRILRRSWLVFALVFLLPFAALANDASRTDLTIDLVSGPVTINAGATQTITGVDVGQSEIQGIDWDAQSSATFTLTFAVTYSNSATGPFNSWTSIHGVSHTGSVATPSWTTSSGTLSSGTYYLRGGTDLRLFPAKFNTWTITNNGASAVTVTRVTMFTY